MRLKLTKPRDAPYGPPWECELVELDTAWIPFILSGLWQKEQRYNWTTDNDAKKARQMLAKQGASILMGCSDKIVDSINQLYRLTDSIHNGAVYTVTGAGTVEDPFIYSPPIPLVPQTQPGAEPGVKFSLEKALRLQDNLVNGTTYTDAPDARNVRQQLEDLILAVQGQGQLDDDMLAKLVQIAALLA